MAKNCLSCGKHEGIVRIQTIMGPVAEEIWLCRACADRYGIDDREPVIEPRTADLLSSLLRPRSPKRRKRKLETELLKSPENSPDRKTDGERNDSVRSGTPAERSDGGRRTGDGATGGRRKTRVFWGDDVPANSRECPSCGLTLARLKKTGRLGCVHCYTVFRRIIDEAMRDQSMSARHVGRLPKRLATYRYVFVDRERIKRELDEAVEKEDYERAGRLFSQMMEADGGAKKSTKGKREDRDDS